MITLPKFKNQKLFEQAFTHRSFLNESKERVFSNERLEFLGDSIISFLVSDYLYKTYPQYNEGILTNLRSLLVNTKSLAETAKRLEFGNLLRLSKGEHEARGRENLSLLADCFEAYTGALFLDQGIQAISQFIHKTLLFNMESIFDKNTLKDPKSLLQEYTQSQKHGSPMYKVLEEQGPAHAKTFTIGAFISGKSIGEGRGKSKQEAEEQAAKKALENMVKK